MIYIGIPARDEARTLGPLLWKIRKVMGEFGRDYQILVLDDASTDDTQEVLERYQEHLPLAVYRHRETRGYAASVESLAQRVAEIAPYPKRDVFIPLQADFTENPEDLVDMVKVLEGGADLVAGYDPQEESRMAWATRWLRRLALFLMGGAARKAPVRNPFLGLRAYRIVVLKKALRDRGERPLCTGDAPWAVNLTLLAATAPHARRIEESEISLRPDLRVRPSRFDAWHSFKALLGVRKGIDWTPIEEPA